MRILYTFVATSVLLFCGCRVDSSRESTPAPEASEERIVTAPPAETGSDGPTVLFFGDSITAGLGLDPVFAFPALVQARADSLGISADMVNAGLSGETSAGGLRRIEWLLRRPVEVLVLELGGNDGLRGISLESTRENLQGIIDRTRALNPDVQVIVAGMMIPPNLGADYGTAFRDLFPDLAAANDARLIPFLLDGVAGVDGMMQSDGIHPTAAGHAVIADLTWPYVRDALSSE